jgi:hypothetical protein
MSEAYTVSDVTPRTAADKTPPTLSATPAATPGTVMRTSSVTLDSNGQVFYTTDGTPAIANGDTPADSARLYTGPIQITAPVKLNVAAFDRAGNSKVLAQGDYAPPAGPTTKPGAPSDLTATEGQQSATLKWTSTDTSISNYRVLEYARPTDAMPVSGAPVRDTPNKTLTITNLTVGKTYWFTVKAENANGFGPESSKVSVTPVGDSVAITTAKWKAGDFRIVGTGSVTGANVTVHRVNADGSIGAAITGATATVTAPVAPATVGDYTIRVRGGAPTTNPGRIVVKSDNGGVTAPFTVVNG